MPAVEGYEFTSEHLTWVKHIYHDDDFIGSIHLVSGLDRFYDGLKKTLAATILIVLTCSTLALVVSLRVLRVIADPIDSLIGTANRISQDQDYSLRAQKFADDDLGSLVDEFNDMLLLIQQRDEELEKRVNERTVELQESNTLLQDSLDEKVVLLKEVHHRVKNNLQIIASLLSLQSNQIDDEETLALFANSEHRVRAMATIHERLYLSQDLAKIDFGGNIEALVEGLIAGYKTSQNISLMTQVDDITLDLDQAIPCGLMINELVSNSLKYAFVDDRLGILEVRMSETADGCRLSVRDEGVGFPADIDFRKSPSLGLQLINTLTHQLGGNIDMKNEEGTEFIIEFPALRGNGEITPA
jgi:two-component sensor histidine kinase